MFPDDSSLKSERRRVVPDYTFTNFIDLKIIPQQNESNEDSDFIDIETATKQLVKVSLKNHCKDYSKSVMSSLVKCPKVKIPNNAHKSPKKKRKNYLAHPNNKRKLEKWESEWIESPIKSRYLKSQNQDIVTMQMSDGGINQEVAKLPLNSVAGNRTAQHEVSGIDKSQTHKNFKCQMPMGISSNIMYIEPDSDNVVGQWV